MSWLELATDLIKKSEGCVLTAYPDPATHADPFTIGFGATGPNICKGLVWTQQQADDDLQQRVQQLGKSIDPLLKVTINDNQKAALCDFAYNLGIHALQESTLLKLLNAGQMDAAANEFEKWDRAGGRVFQGLLNRRLAEKKLFLSPAAVPAAQS